MEIEEAVTLLGIDGEITSENIDLAYKKLASVLHPDKGGNSEEMARLNEARDLLHENVSKNNLPTITKQFETAIKEINIVAREQRALEKRVERSEKEIRASATSRLKSYKNMALILATLSAAAFFLGKDLPRELISRFTPAVGPAPISVSKPVENDLVKAAQSKIDNSKANKINFKLTTEENKALEKYQSDIQKYSDYESLMARYRQSEVEANDFTFMWYATTFVVGIYAGVGAWFFNRRIGRIEEELGEFFEDLSFKSQYTNLLLDLFEDKLNNSWTFKDLLAAITNNRHRNNRLSRLVSAVGNKKMAQLLINKGLESSAITVLHGNSENEYEETYSLA